MRAHQVPAPREIIRALNRRVLQRANLTADDEGLDGDPAQVGWWPDLRSQPALGVVEFVSAEHHVEQFASADALSASAAARNSATSPARLAGRRRWARRRADHRRTGQRYRGLCRRHDGEHRKHGEQTPQSASSNGKARSSTRHRTLSRSRSVAGVVSPVICVRETDGERRMRLPTRTRQTILHPSVGQLPRRRTIQKASDGPTVRAWPTPYDAILLVSFGGPEGPDDVIPFLENVTRGRGILANGSPRSVSITPTSAG